MRRYFAVKESVVLLDVHAALLHPHEHTHVVLVRVLQEMEKYIKPIILEMFDVEGKSSRGKRKGH